MSCMAVYKGAALYRVVLSIAHTVPHRRRIKTEETAKVITTVWRTELIQFFAIFLQDYLKNGMNLSYSILISSWFNSSYSSIRTGGK